MLGGGEVRHQAGGEPAGLHGVEVAHFLRHIQETGDGLVVAGLLALLQSASCTIPVTVAQNIKEILNYFAVKYFMNLPLHLSVTFNLINCSPL